MVKLLSLSHAPLPMEDLLQQILSALLNSVPWLRLIPRAGIFISTQGEKGRDLRLVASRNFSPAHRASCARVPYGKCLCGIAALNREIQFSDCVDARHEIQYAGMVDHGHYIVPIVSDDKLIGVMVLYLSKGYERVYQEEGFLHRVADVLAMSISRKQGEDRIEQLAYYDPLTHLPNRRLLLDRLQLELAVAARRHRYGAVLFLDLDQFKDINDTLGHAIGDTLLQEVGKRLSAQMRSEDTVARLGGDEFIVLLPDLGNNASKAARRAAIVAKKIQAVLHRPVILLGGEHRIRASIGITLFPTKGDGINETLQQADTAMYKAKVDGRNIIRFFKPKMQARVDKRLVLEKELGRALERGELRLYLQPLVDDSTRIVAAESLLRWWHERLGLLLPSEFIPIAEDTGLILPISDWVMHQACVQLNTWVDLHGTLGAFRLSINVGSHQFRQADFVDKVERILEVSGANPQALVIELTEDVAIANLEDSIIKMRALKGIGIQCAIDNFGSGCSSLVYLRRLPLEQLKIDGAFVRDIANDPRGGAFTNTLISLVRELGLEVVAEGVETETEFRFLKNRDCRMFQGRYFSPPMPAEKFLALAEQNKPLLS